IFCPCVIFKEDIDCTEFFAPVFCRLLFWPWCDGEFWSYSRDVNFHFVRFFCAQKYYKTKQKNNKKKALRPSRIKKTES
ncbi:hypothetical protein DKP78_17820, partial [Enterococcus faecium]